MQRGVVKFNSLETIFKNSKIKKASLQLYQHKLGIGNTANATLYFHKVTAPWDENICTWNASSNGSSWETKGGDIEPTPFLKVTVVPGKTLNSWHTFDVTDLIKEFVAKPESNHGFLALEEVRSDIIFCSSEYPKQELRPKLVVQYEPSTTVNHSLNPLTHSPSITRTKNFVAISFDNKKSSQITIVDSRGRQYYSQISTNEQHLKIPMNKMPSGLSILTIKDKLSGAITVHKIQ